MRVAQGISFEEKPRSRRRPHEARTGAVVTESIQYQPQPCYSHACLCAQRWGQD